MTAIHRMDKSEAPILSLIYHVNPGSYFSISFDQGCIRTLLDQTSSRVYRIETYHTCLKTTKHAQIKDPFDEIPCVKPPGMF